MFQSQSAAWTDLGLITFGQGDVQTCRYKTALHGMKRYGTLDIGTEVHSCALWRSISRQLLMATIDYFNLNHFEMLHSYKVQN